MQKGKNRQKKAPARWTVAKQHMQLFIVVSLFFAMVLFKNIVGAHQFEATPAFVDFANSTSPTDAITGFGGDTPPYLGSDDDEQDGMESALAPDDDVEPGPSVDAPMVTSDGGTTETASVPTVAQSPPVSDPTIAPTSTPTPKGQYQDGTFTGRSIDAYYGYVKVSVSVNNGRISDIALLDYPQHSRTSKRINRIALPMLTEEAIQAQGPRIHIISGASATSEAFAESVYTALQGAG